MDKQAAQHRADQICAFRAELQALREDGVLTLPDEARARLRAYHDDILRHLSSQFDVDTSHEQKRLSWGMRIVQLGRHQLFSLEQ